MAARSIPAQTAQRLDGSSHCLTIRHWQNIAFPRQTPRRQFRPLLSIRHSCSLQCIRQSSVLLSNATSGYVLHSIAATAAALLSLTQLRQRQWLCYMEHRNHSWQRQRPATRNISDPAPAMPATRSITVMATALICHPVHLTSDPAPALYGISIRPGQRQSTALQRKTLALHSIVIRPWATAILHTPPRTVTASAQQNHTLHRIRRSKEARNHATGRTIHGETAHN